MSTALATKPGKTRIGLPGRSEFVDFKAGTTVGTYLKALGAEIRSDQIPVVGGRPADLDTVVPENAAVTVARRPQNG